MKREDVLEWWAPDEASWVDWVKPVAFACMRPHVKCRGPTRRAAWLRPKLLAPLGELDQTAVVVDLPSAGAVWVGVALAKRGVRPIPLYNAVQHGSALVDMRPIMAALVNAASQSSIALPAQAPPAFLLDSQRMAAVPRRPAAIYDNRWVCRAEDFPSARRLSNGGVRRVLLIQDEPGPPAPDLDPILRAWQAAGLPLWRLARKPASPAAPFSLALRPWPLRFLRWCVDNTPGVRPRRDGSYGRWLEHGG